MADGSQIVMSKDDIKKLPLKAVNSKSVYIRGIAIIDLLEQIGAGDYESLTFIGTTGTLILPHAKALVSPILAIDTYTESYSRAAFSLVDGGNWLGEITTIVLK